MAQTKKTQLDRVPPADDLEARQKFALAFAKAMAQQTIHDPAGKTSRRTSRTYTTYTRENIEEWLSSPTSNEKNLRDASVFLYQTNSRYRNLLHYYANVPCWLYTISTPDNTIQRTFAQSDKCGFAHCIDNAHRLNDVTSLLVLLLKRLAFYFVRIIVDGRDGVEPTRNIRVIMQEVPVA